MLTLTN